MYVKAAQISKYFFSLLSGIDSARISDSVSKFSYSCANFLVFLSFDCLSHQNFIKSLLSLLLRRKKGIKL